MIDSRSSREGAAVRRRRECTACGHRFSTYEEIVQTELKVLKRNDKVEDLDRGKLRLGVEKACWKRNVLPEQIDNLVSDVIASIERDYDRDVPSSEIGRRVMEALRKLDKVAYVRFASVYRDFKDIDEFIEEIRTIGTRDTSGRSSKKN